MTLELAPPLLTTTPHQQEDVSALDRFNVHRCPTRWVFSGTGLELMTRQATWHGGTETIRRAASPLVRLVEGEESWDVLNGWGTLMNKSETLPMKEKE
ncbi:uncharacterized protein TNCV_4521181 [Trichonephila clavipes]|nr:uncharacterized protein TNCV_4521181 [Trichonephila clavipes]